MKILFCLIKLIIPSIAILLLLNCYISAYSSPELSSINFMIRSQKNLPGGIGVFKHIQILNDSNIDLYSVTLNKKYHSNLYLQDETSQENAKFIDDISAEQNFTIAINGGYYLPNFKPLGLIVYKQKIQQSIRNSRLLNACITITQDGRLSLNKISPDCKLAFYSLQAGPLIINNGQVDTKISSMSSNIQSFYGPRRRTLIAESKNGDILILVTSAISLWEIANILQKHSDIFGLADIDKAINLDGGSSTSMYVRFKDQPFYYPEIKPIKTILFFQ